MTHADLPCGAGHTEALSGHHGIDRITVCADNIARSLEPLTNTTLPTTAHTRQAADTY